MKHGSGIRYSRRLSNVQRLLREEKCLVHALKFVEEERHELQREGIEILALLQEALLQGKPSAALGQEGLQAFAKLAIEQLTTVKPTTATADVQEPIPTSLSLADQFPENEEFKEIIVDDECEN